MEDPIKKKIQELVPDIAKRCNGGSPCLCEMILLSDVLRAMFLSGNCRDGYYSVGTDGGFYRVRYTYPDKEHCVITHDGIGGAAYWDFRNDNYDAQTKETQLFIGSLLGV